MDANVTGWISAGSAMLVAISAAIAACSAYLGINTWRRQMRGKDEYKLTRDLLVSIYRHRDAMHDARHWFMTIAHEPAREEAEKMTKKQVDFYGLSRTYLSRWEKVEKQHQRIYKDLILAEVLWGTKLRDLLGSLLKPEQDLKAAITENLWFRNPDNEISRGENWRKDVEALRPILYGEPADEFGQRIENGIKPAEKYLKRKLEIAMDV